MGRWLQMHSISSKLRLMTGLSLVAISALAVWQGFSTHGQAMSARQASTRQVVETVYGVLEWAHGLEAAGEVERAEAQELAKSAVAALRYRESDYFWINDMHPHVVMHPIKPALDGKDVTDTRDPNGLQVFVAFANKVREDGEGFVPYMWPKPGQEEPAQKLSYVKGFEPWGWVVGSGIYIDDVRAEVLAYVKRLSSVLLVVLVLSILAARQVSRSITGPIVEADRIARAIADGDISQRIEAPDGRDEISSLMRSMARMSTNLCEMVSVVQESAHGMERAAKEISDGNHDLSNRTIQAAGSLEETSATMDQINERVGRNAESALRARELASFASKTSQEGCQAVAAVVETMDDISKSSQKISDIIGVIDGIAFQTNILALNAAVEAARAGEQGRGFAVVATEVGSLASRSAEASQQVRDLILESVKRVERGATLVADAGETIERMSSAVEQVNELVGGIHEASSDQATGIGEINIAVSSLDEMTHQNSALVEQSAAATDSLCSRARDLAVSVSAFRVSQD